MTVDTQHSCNTKHSIVGRDGQAYEVRSVPMGDDLVKPLLTDLAREYFARYSSFLEEKILLDEMTHYPAADFAAPDGDFILLISAGAAAAGGALRLCTEPELGDVAFSAFPGAQRNADGTPSVRTAELKRIWTHADYRRKGLARLLLTALEQRAVELGYVRIYLTTGSRQPEAERLYQAAGYTALFDTTLERRDEEGPLAFEKWLVDPA